MAKVLWLQNLWIEFMGIMSISSLLNQKGHQSDIIYDSKEGIVDYIYRYQPDAIAFSCMSVQWKWAKEVSTYIKQRGITTPIIAGGIHSTMYPDNAISHPDIDIICLNEGEYPMLDFMDAIEQRKDFSGIPNLWVKKNRTVIKNSTRPKLTAQDLDNLPFPDRTLYKKYDHFRNYPFEIFVGSRGCPFKCSFCEVPEINAMYGGKSTHYRDPVKFVDEIEDVKKRGMLDNKLVMFTDSTFNSHKKWFLQFLEEYRRRINVPFSCNLRVDLVDEKQVKALAESGCDNVRFGVESGDADIRNRILDKHLTDEQIFKAADLLHKYKIPFVTFNLFGNVEESYEQAWKTIKINRRIKPAAMGAYVFVLFPGIRATNYAIEKKFIDESDLDKLEQPPYNIHLSLLALHPERSKDIVKICNLQKFAIVVSRHPWLEPLVRLLVMLPPLEIFGSFYAICQTWEWRKWSTKTTFRRLLYEGILNYQALIETRSDKKSIVGRLSLWLGRKVGNKIKKPIGSIGPNSLEAHRERMLTDSFGK